MNNRHDFRHNLYEGPIETLNSSENTMGNEINYNRRHQASGDNDLRKSGRLSSPLKTFAMQLHICRMTRKLSSAPASTVNLYNLAALKCAAQTFFRSSLDDARTCCHNQSNQRAEIRKFRRPDHPHSFYQCGYGRQTCSQGICNKNAVDQRSGSRLLSADEGGIRCARGKTGKAGQACYPQASSLKLAATPQNVK